jgi:Flp pilus assembly protein TadG
VTDGFIAEGRGQALVIVAAAMAVLIGALGMSVEWGHGFVERREAQNHADAAAIAVGRHLASTFVASSEPFSTTVEQLCTDASRFSSATGEILTLSFADESQAMVTFVGTSEETVSTNACAAAAGQQLPAEAVFVHVRADRSYPSVLGSAFGAPTMSAGASARARLTSGALLRPLQLLADPACVGCIAGDGVSGLSTAPSVAIWPVVRYFDPAEFAAGVPCGAYCDRSSVVPTRLLRRGGSPSAFRLLIAPLHDSPRTGGHQLVTQSDWSASDPSLSRHPYPTTPLVTTHGESGCAAQWTSQGSRDLRSAASCDVPNWFWYGYRGSLSLSTDWTSWAGRGYLPAASVPAALPSGATRFSCQRVPAHFPTPSCAMNVGDWVETIGSCDGACDDPGGELTTTMVANIRHFISQYGRELPSAPGVKAVVINMFMWDCADQFRSGAWSRIGSNCDPISSDALRTVGRIHLFTVVPFTVYEDGVVDGFDAHVDAYWGNAFGDAGSCQQSWNTVPTPVACRLNPLMNSAFLVPDHE